MKNIFLIATDKPSPNILLKDDDGTMTLFNQRFYDMWLFHQQFGDFAPSNATYQHIYITSDERIKEGDWVIKISSLYKGGGIIQKYSFIDSQFEDIIFKKIILTTDQDLIADGVQAIDDEFLEWFVKNPSCEKVEVYEVNGKLFADPIIPQEEPKQEALEEAAEKFCDIPKKQSGDKYKFSAHDRLLYNTFIEGAKWQAERMYSEEEVKRLCSKAWLKIPNTPNMLEEFDKWFEQFKKSSDSRTT